MNIDWMPASDELDVLRKMVSLVGELLDCLPDNRKWIDDDTWKWCWEELSEYAQSRVASVRRKAIELLSEIEKAQGGIVNIDQLPAGRELDALVAEKVMEWHLYRDDRLLGLPPEATTAPYLLHLLPVLSYSTDIAAAWEVVQVLNQQGYTLRLTGPEIPDTTGYLIEESWSAAFVGAQYAFTGVGQSQGKGPTPSLAICRAALKVMAES